MTSFSCEKIATPLATHHIMFMMHIDYQRLPEITRDSRNGGYIVTCTLHWSPPTQMSTFGQERLTSGDLLVVKEGKLPPRYVAVHCDVIELIWEV